jgi:hypothetical protein
MTYRRKKVHHAFTGFIARPGILHLLNQRTANHYSVGQAGNRSRIIRGLDTETNGNRQIAV